MTLAQAVNRLNPRLEIVTNSLFVELLEGLKGAIFRDIFL
jgi:hypothetical protein